MSVYNQHLRPPGPGSFRYDGPAHITAAAALGDNKYEPDGGYAPAAIWGLPLAAGLLFCLPAWGYIRLAYWTPALLKGGSCFSLLVTWGALAALISIVLVRIFKVRDPLLAVLLTLAGSFLAWLISFFLVYQVAGDGIGFFKFYYERLKNGVVVDFDLFRSGGRGYPVYKLVSGFGLVVIWLCEGAALGLIASLGASFQARRPFSVRRNRWYTRVALPRRRPEDGELNILARLSANMIITYLSQQAADYPRLGRFGFFRHHYFQLRLYLDPDEGWQYAAITCRLGRVRSNTLRYLRVDNSTATVLLEKFG